MSIHAYCTDQRGEAWRYISIYTTLAQLSQRFGPIFSGRILPTHESFNKREIDAHGSADQNALLFSYFCPCSHAAGSWVDM